MVVRQNRKQAVRYHRTMTKIPNKIRWDDVNDEIVKEYSERKNDLERVSAGDLAEGDTVDFNITKPIGVGEITFTGAEVTKVDEIFGDLHGLWFEVGEYFIKVTFPGSDAEVYKDEERTATWKLSRIRRETTDDESDERRVCTDGGTDTGEHTDPVDGSDETGDESDESDESPEALPGYGNRPGKPPETIGTPTASSHWTAWDDQNVLTTPEEQAICNAVRDKMAAMIDAKNGHDSHERFNKRDYICLAQALRRVRPSEQTVALWADSLER